MAFSFLTQELAIDLGTANTVIFMNDKIVVDEPSIVAIDQNTGKPIAFGHAARMMHERTHPNSKTIRPLRDGVIADFNAAEQMIRGFVKMINNKRSLFTPNLKWWSAFRREAPRWKSEPSGTHPNMPEAGMYILSTSRWLQRWESVWTYLLRRDTW